MPGGIREDIESALSQVETQLRFWVAQRAPDDVDVASVVQATCDHFVARHDWGREILEFESRERLLRFLCEDAWQRLAAPIFGRAKQHLLDRVKLLNFDATGSRFDPSASSVPAVDAIVEATFRAFAGKHDWDHEELGSPGRLSRILEGLAWSEIAEAIFVREHSPVRNKAAGETSSLARLGLDPDDLIQRTKEEVLAQDPWRPHDLGEGPWKPEVLADRGRTRGYLLRVVLGTSKEMYRDRYGRPNRRDGQDSGEDADRTQRPKELQMDSFIDVSGGGIGAREQAIRDDMAASITEFAKRAGLSDGDIQALGLAANGHTAREIGELLGGKSPDAVRADLMRKRRRVSEAAWMDHWERIEGSLNSLEFRAVLDGAWDRASDPREIRQARDRAFEKMRDRIYEDPGDLGIRVFWATYRLGMDGPTIAARLGETEEFVSKARDCAARVFLGHFFLD